MGPNQIAPAAVRRSNQQYFEQVSERETLSCGYAYFNSAHPGLPLCNFVGEVLLESATGDPFAEVSSFYTARNLSCYRWIPAANQPAEPVGALLEPHGFEHRESMTYVLPLAVECAPDRRYRFLGARAMRRAYVGLMSARTRERPEVGPDWTEVQLGRLDDPQYDAFVAILGERLVGAIAVYQVGEIGRITDLYTVPDARRSGVATALLQFAATTARRWALRPICAQVAADNAAGRALLRQFGFEEGGTIVSFCRAGAAEVIP